MWNSEWKEITADIEAALADARRERKALRATLRRLEAQLDRRHVQMDITLLEMEAQIADLRNLLPPR